MLKVEKIIKDSTAYTISTLASQFIGMLTSIAMRRFLTPEMMGIWTTLLLILNYSLFAELGVFTAIEVRIPYLRGKNISTEIQAMRNTAFTFAAVISFIIVLVLFAASFVLAGRMPGYIVLGIRIVALIIAATFFYNLYIVMLRADKSFFLLSKAIVFNSLAMLLFVSILTYFFRLKGIYFATLFATIASWGYINFNTRYSLRLHFDPRLIRSLSKIGLPILIAGITYVILFSIDKIMIIRMLGPKELGYYSIAILALTYAYNFPKLFGIVLFPSLQEEFGKSDSKERILGYIKQMIFVMAYLFPAILAIVYFGIPILVHYVLPKYTLGIDSMKILLCGCFFISFVPMTHNFIITVNKQIILVPITAAAVLFGIAINYSAIKMGYGIEGVAFGTSVAYFLYFMIMCFYVLSHCEKWPGIFGYFLKICVPFVYSLIVLITLEHLIKNVSMISRITVQALVFYITYIPLFWYINKNANLVLRFLNRKPPILPRGEMILTAVAGEEQNVP